MTGKDALLTLAKGKLNITWNDDGTNARLEAILCDAIPAVANMVGLLYDFTEQEARNRDKTTFDFSQPCMERSLLLNYMAYEWNHQAEAFRENYWQEIAACRQVRALEDADSEDGE